MHMAGYDVTAVESGEQALALAREVRPDAILLDLQLPGVSGFEVARILRGSDVTAAIPIIAVTGLTPPPDRRSDGWDRFVSIVPKPCDPCVLLLEVERVLAESVATRAEVDPRDW